jgi:hypothetical protein
MCIEVRLRLDDLAAVVDPVAPVATPTTAIDVGGACRSAIDGPQAQDPTKR